MRDGETVGTWPIGELTVRKVVELMVGDAMDGDGATPCARAPEGEPRLVLESLAAEGTSTT